MYMNALLLTTLSISFNASAFIGTLDHFVELGVPKEPLMKVLNYLQENPETVKNQEYVTIIDFSKHSSEKRLYLLDLVGETLQTMHVAHGEGTDPGNTGYATDFSNIVDSHMSSLGMYLTAETYYGQNGYSLRLDGLSETNSRARERYIVVHGSNYINPETNEVGRSWGCPSVSMDLHVEFIDKIKNESILYIFN